jgi:ribosomal RNA assembly protein
MPVLFVRIPEDRVGVLIGTGGQTKTAIESRTSTSLDVDAGEGAVRVSAPDDGDPMGALQARDLVLAIGRGFSPQRAWRLTKENTYLGVIDIKRVTGKREKAAMWRIRSRLIGVGGRARSRMEDLSGCSISVYGNTVALIGDEKQLERATRAVEMLLRGSEHSVVFHMLARQRTDAALEEAITTTDLDSEV